MNINQAVVVTAISVVAGTFSLNLLNQVNAANPSYQVAQASQQPNQRPDGQRRPPHPDFAAAAAKLGVTEQRLKDALGVPANPPSQGDRNQRPPRPDFKAAAAKLGVTEQQLKDALGVPPHPHGNRQHPPRPDFAAAAAKLGVTEQQLKDALGVPANLPSQAGIEPRISAQCPFGLQLPPFIHALSVDGQSRTQGICCHFLTRKGKICTSTDIKLSG